MIKNIGWFAVSGQVVPILFHKNFLKDSERKTEVQKWRKIIARHPKIDVIPFGKGIFSHKSILVKLSVLKSPLPLWWAI